MIGSTFALKRGLHARVWQNFYVGMPLQMTSI